ncbi:heme oxygenase (biliverdin-producing) [Curtobacterium sp. ME12]|uniref:biliverdin-producing heme oxygenase n=1 Tax=Curtobacterium sp. ME12 TaxID=2744253 RepID=UPI002174EC4A|nr:biliverdin-producing heme oxygenase [Curtobacterium sp. ME12]
MTDTVIPFSELLRTRTRRSHSASARGGFLHDLVAGRCTVQDYTALLVQYSYLYNALEQASETMRKDPVARLFVSEQLTRLPAIHADLEFLAGPDWREQARVLPATTRYVERVRNVAARWPGGFIAHHYTRYLGDLSGGQMIGRSLAKQFAFDTNGIGFFIFDQVADPSAFKDTYRAQLDAVPWGDDERERVIQEVVLAYDFNQAMLDGLDTMRAGTAGETVGV